MGCLAGVLVGMEESLNVTLSGCGAARAGWVARGTVGLPWSVVIHLGVCSSVTSSTLVC